MIDTNILREKERWKIEVKKNRIVRFYKYFNSRIDKLWEVHTEIIYLNKI